MHNNPFYVLCDRPFLLQIAGYIVFAEHSNERCQESGAKIKICRMKKTIKTQRIYRENLPGLTMGGCHNVILCDQHAAAFIFRE